MVRVSKPFLYEVLWPEFNKFDRMFEELGNEIIQDLISKIYGVKEEEEIVVGGELPLSEEATTLC